mmetsp:Transcript_7085/g.25904  ORF Transcript_7085/g.25904 Transcript_7085/m.25904 type:complete len:374 (+) Transcript_7085:122-1243(+)
MSIDAPSESSVTEAPSAPALTLRAISSFEPCTTRACAVNNPSSALGKSMRASVGLPRYEPTTCVGAANPLGNDASIVPPRELTCTMCTRSANLTLISPPPESRAIISSPAPSTPPTSMRPPSDRTTPISLTRKLFACTAPPPVLMFILSPNIDSPIKLPPGAVSTYTKDPTSLPEIVIEPPFVRARVSALTVRARIAPPFVSTSTLAPLIDPSSMSPPFVRTRNVASTIDEIDALAPAAPNVTSTPQKRGGIVTRNTSPPPSLDADASLEMRTFPSSVRSIAYVGPKSSVSTSTTSMTSLAVTTTRVFVDGALMITFAPTAKSSNATRGAYALVNATARAARASIARENMRARALARGRWRRDGGATAAARRR